MFNTGGDANLWQKHGKTNRRQKFWTGTARKVFGYKELSDSRRVSGGRRDGWRLLSEKTEQQLLKFWTILSHFSDAPWCRGAQLISWMTRLFAVDLNPPEFKGPFSRSVAFYPRVQSAVWKKHFFMRIIHPGNPGHLVCKGSNSEKWKTGVRRI